MFLFTAKGYNQRKALSRQFTFILGGGRKFCIQKEIVTYFCDNGNYTVNTDNAYYRFIIDYT